MQRTTLILDEEVYRAVKRKAVDRGRSMRALVEEALRAYLGLSKVGPKAPRPKFRVFQARVLGSLTREEIYKEHLDRKFR